MPPDAPRRRATIADVARRAGVSNAAVSFAVNDRPGVGAETRARILRAAEDLGWQPSVHARALTGARVRAIGLVLARDPAQLEADAFFVRFLAGLERTLAPHDHALLLQILPEPDAAAYERLTRSGRVDGFILTDVEVEDQRFPVLEAAGVPTVVAGHPAADCAFPWVETEHASGMRVAVEHLRAAGHERIGFLGGPSNLDYVQVRRANWRAALGDERSAVHVEPGGSATHAAARLLATGVTAVACTSDVLALAVVAAGSALGIRVPEELSVVGFDDSALAALSVPALSSVRVDYEEFGAAAAAALLALIEGRDAAPKQLSAPELVLRASTGPPR